MLIKASNFALSDAFEASVPKLCAGRSSYWQREAPHGNETNAVKDTTYVAFATAQIPRRGFPLGVDP
jgi:hypothetical protein